MHCEYSVVWSTPTVGSWGTTTDAQPFPYYCGGTDVYCLLLLSIPMTDIVPSPEPRCRVYILLFLTVGSLCVLCISLLEIPGLPEIYPQFGERESPVLGKFIISHSGWCILVKNLPCTGLDFHFYSSISSRSSTSPPWILLAVVGAWRWFATYCCTGKYV